MSHKDHLLQKIQIKECNHMDTTQEACELLSRVFETTVMREKEIPAQEKTKGIISACMKSADWMENVSTLAGVCKDCISNLLQCLSRDMDQEFSYMRFSYYLDMYMEISSTLSSLLMSNTRECLNPPADFPEELSSSPFSEDISVQFSSSIGLLEQIQKYAKNRQPEALAYCLQILFVTDLHNMRMCDEKMKKHQTT